MHSYVPSNKNTETANCEKKLLEGKELKISEISETYDITQLALQLNIKSQPLSKTKNYP